MKVRGHMRTFNYIIGSILGAGLALTGAGCGDSGADCGNGTTEVDGVCVPNIDGCATGTTLVNGECVPDGSVICGDGTTYNETTGECEPDSVIMCGEGTVDDGTGNCVDPNTLLDPDVDEPAEPNDGSGTPGAITIPTEGNSLTIGGCVDPADAGGDSDEDWYLFDVTAPTLLDVTVMGYDGLAGGFVVQSADAQLFNNGWIRFGVNLVDTTSSRQVYLPKAGTYVLAITDSRSLFLGPAGGPDACYYATVETLAIPSATAITDTATGTLDDVDFYSYDPAVDGAVVDALLDATAMAQNSDLVVSVNGSYVGSAIPHDDGLPALGTFSSLADDDVVVIAVDHVYNYSLSDVDYMLTVAERNVLAEPGDGSTVTITHDDTAVQLLAFEATAGDVFRLELPAPVANFDILLFPPNTTDFSFGGGLFIGDICFNCADVDTWIQALETGYYYLAVFNLDAVQDDMYDMEWTRTHVTPAAVTVGTTATGDLSNNNDRDFYTFDPTGNDWIELLVSPTAGAGFTDGLVTIYPRGEAGQLDVIVAELDSDLTDFARIIPGETDMVLVSVEDFDGHDGDETFDFDVTLKDYDDLGTVDDMTALQSVVTGSAAEEFYLFFGSPTDELTLTVTGQNGLDPIVALLDFDESENVVDDTTGADTVETLTLRAGDGWIAFAVRDVAGTGGDYTIDVTARTPLVIAGNTGIAIPDSDANGVTDTATNSMACTIAEAQVALDVSHTWIGDLEIIITSPDGTALTMHANSGGSADDIVGTYPIDLTPADSLDDWISESAMGDWELFVADTAGGDTGTVNSWSVNVFCAP